MDGLKNIGSMDMIVVGVRALISGFHSKDVPHESCRIDVEGWEKATILQIISDHYYLTTSVVVCQKLMSMPLQVHAAFRMKMQLYHSYNYSFSSTKTLT